MRRFPRPPDGRGGYLTPLRTLRPHFPLIAILLAAAAARFAILVHAQTHVHSDEAIIGLMGKHILEGRYFPFYMYGQDYNAGAAWEAYAAAASFAAFGLGVVPLKGCIVALSLVSLFLFHRAARALYGGRAAILATLVLALSPSLLKWHFQVRGYSWYFLAIPLLTGLFHSVDAASSPRTKRVFVFGLASGITVWSLELALILVAALWAALALRRKLSRRDAALGLGGFVVGYGPAIVFNVTHGLANWRDAFADKAQSMVWPALLQPSTLVDVFVRELPKFFGADTVLWYYPETPLTGIALYAVAAIVLAATVLPFLRSPARMRAALRGELATCDESRDAVVLALTGACLATYLAAPQRVPGYLLGASFFLALLTGRLLERCFSTARVLPRALGRALLSVVVLTGVHALAETGRNDQIETLTLNEAGTAYALTRIPGADIERVQDHLTREGITSVGATISFVYPLLFESAEALAVSDAMFGRPHLVYPPRVAWREPRMDRHAAWVVETGSPQVRAVEDLYTRAVGAPPRIAVYGALTVLDGGPRGASRAASGRNAVGR